MSVSEKDQDNKYDNLTFDNSDNQNDDKNLDDLLTENKLLKEKLQVYEDMIENMYRSKSNWHVFHDFLDPFKGPYNCDTCDEVEVEIGLKDCKKCIIERFSSRLYRD